jgi:hypothetical protein
MPENSIAARRRAPAIGEGPAFDDGRDIACAVAMQRAAEKPVSQIDCTLVNAVSGTSRCPGKSARNCVGDFPSEETEIQEAGG